MSKIQQLLDYDQPDDINDTPEPDYHEMVFELVEEDMLFVSMQEAAEAFRRSVLRDYYNMTENDLRALYTRRIGQ